jgi:hypothetical protein
MSWRTLGDGRERSGDGRAAARASRCRASRAIVARLGESLSGDRHPFDAPFRPTELLQVFTKGGNLHLPIGIVFRIGHYHPNPVDALLRARREGLGSRCAAEA